ncbi:FUSC family protein [Sphingomonas crusticola]|uniref:FUSC family protein n=1 Tax=Sphingomonas crusticola TaxID=1697973 RepID=UPI000E27AE33|nr:FUSC family protein [Sphingomonas crusticola]
MKAILDARRVDELECVASVLLAILFAHWIGASNVSWAAFSGYMVMRGHVAESFIRGLLRIVGTAAGALLGLAITPLVAGDVLLTSLGLAAIGGTMLYAALTAKRAYAWLFVGLTFVMILLDKVQHPDIAIIEFARTRMLEVIAGTVACVVISTASTLTLRRIWPAERSASPARVGWHPHAARHAAQAALALLILPALGAWLHLPALSQSAVAIMAVMLVPVTSLGVSGFVPVSRRLLNRVVGCLAGAALAACFLFIARGSAPILILGTIIGVAAGRHLENGKGALAYAGTQFVLAILVTLVPDSYADAHIGPAADRLLGTLIGMALLEPVLLLWHLIARDEARNASAADAEAGGV